MDDEQVYLEGAVQNQIDLCCETSLTIKLP